MKCPFPHVPKETRSWENREALLTQRDFGTELPDNDSLENRHLPQILQEGAEKYLNHTVSLTAPAFPLFFSISSPVPLLKRGICPLICPLQHPSLAQGDGKPWSGYSHEIYSRDLHSTVISTEPVLLTNLFCPLPRYFSNTDRDKDRLAQR